MSEEMDFIGKRIGNYQLTSRISSGGFGQVYLARHTLLKERVVAVKLLHMFLQTQQEQEQFLQEAQLLESLKHRYILPLLDVGFLDTTSIPYLITEYASGGSLRDRLNHIKTQPVSIEQAVAILAQVGEALYFAHQHNIIHRDLKPENILFNAQGDALLADFGIAT